MWTKSLQDIDAAHDQNTLVQGEGLNGNYFYFCFNVHEGNFESLT